VRAVAALAFAAAALLGPARPAAADWVAFGNFYYRDREQDLDGFTGVEVDRPARRVDVEVVDVATSAVLGSGATDDLGHYEVAVTDNAVRTIRVRFLTRSNYTPGLYLQVQNNQGTRVVYAATTGDVPGHDPSTDVYFGDLTVLPGSGGEPFNCYDVTLNGQNHVASLYGAWPSQAIVVFWQAGSADGTYYRDSDNTVHLLGDEGYDDTVIAHEHGHFVAKKFSKDQNPGGTHFIGDNNQDLRLSWSEGYATYWGSTVRRQLGLASPNPTFYIDTTGLPGTGNLDFSYELETPSVSAVGSASEISVQAVLWDIVDTPATGDLTPGVDDDLIVDATDADIWNITRNYLPQGFVSNVSLEDFWDGWFDPGFALGRYAEMVDAFGALRVEFFEDAFENDDGVGAGGPIAEDGSPQAHTFYPVGDNDYAWFAASAGEQFIVETTDLISDANTRLAVTDTTGMDLVVNDNRASGDESSRILFTAPYEGRFYARANHAADLGVYGSYNLRVLRGAPSAVTFDNYSTTSGTGASGNSRGSAWGDFDGDGWLDLFVTNLLSSNQLFRNQGDGTFANQAVARGVALSTQSEGACWGDYDNDGDLDLYLATVGTDDVLYRNQLIEIGTPNFVNATAAAGITDAASGRSPSWIDADRDGHLDLFVANLENGPCRFWRNLGNGTFADATAASGLGLTGAITACWADFDRDGDSDVFVGVNGGPSHLMRNDGGVFTDVTGSAGTVGGLGTFGAHAGDYNGDGLYDIVIAESNGANYLYRNDGGLAFTDVSVAANAASPFISVGSIFLDHDLDGDQDLFTANFNSPGQLYDNVTGASFSITGAAAISVQARSASVADFDRDGDPDLYIPSVTSNLLLRNLAPPTPWLQVRTIGRSSNRDGYGAQVYVSAGGRGQRREITSGQGFGSQNSPWAQFGLGAGVTSVDTVIVDWPSRKRSLFTGVATNAILVADEAGAVSVDEGEPLLARLRLSAPRPNPAARGAVIELEAPAHLSGQPLRLDVYDVAGRRIATLHEGTAGPGPLRLEWDLTDASGRRVGAGVYLARARCGPEAAVRKLAVVER
jgi:hypothetical protein